MEGTLFGWGAPKPDPTKKTLIVALWSINTQGMQQAPLDLRWRVLKKCVEHAYELALKRLATQGLDLNDKPFALFVAPEYLMAQPDPSGRHAQGSRRHMDEADKDNLLQRFIALSNTCKGMLMIPGTIAWRKSLERSGWDVNHMRADHPQWGQPKTVSRYDKAIGSVQFYQQRQGFALTDRLSRALNSGVLAPTTQQKLDALNQAKALVPHTTAHGYAPNDLRYMARNTAYVLLDGLVRLKYNKQADFHEIQDGTSTVHIPGKMDGRFGIQPTNPKQRGIRFGLEVCLDHAYQTTGKEIAQMGKVDVHIITSAQLPTRDANVATVDAGYVVHASSNADYTGVKSRGWFGGNEKPFATETISTFPLQLWQIELDLAFVEPTPETAKAFGESSSWLG